MQTEDDLPNAAPTGDRPLAAMTILLIGYAIFGVPNILVLGNTTTEAGLG